MDSAAGCGNSGECEITIQFIVSLSRFAPQLGSRLQDNRAVNRTSRNCTVPREGLLFVERANFTPPVEMLVQHSTSSVSLIEF